METIKTIKEVDNYKVNDNYSEFEGYIITTDEQEIYVLIDNDQGCCEDFGTLTSYENPNQFVGAGLIKIDIVDEAMNKKKWDKATPYGLDAGKACFVNFETTKGTFQLTAYNCHNGYYGHEVLVKSKHLNHEEYL